MSRIPLGWLLALVVAILLVVGALAVGSSGNGKPGPKIGSTGSTKAATNAGSQAAAICEDAEDALAGLPESPSSVAAAVRLEHDALAIYRREVSRLEGLAPQEDASFQAGVATDQELLHGLSSMLARPDFVRLSLTLPGHPSREPGWLKEWLAREQHLLAKAHGSFAQAGVPACEKSLG